jgi:hypothetical protein
VIHGSEVPPPPGPSDPFISPSVGKTVFFSANFSRHHVELSPACSITCDTLPENGTEIRFFRWLASSPNAMASFRFPGEVGGFVTDDRVGALINEGADGRGPLVWFPRAILVGRKDEYGRMTIADGDVVESWWELNDSPTLHLRLSGSERAEVFWPMAIFAEDSGVSESNLSRLTEVEQRRVVKSDWFDASSPADLWKYFLEGGLYDPRDEGHGRFRCQQCAFAWWGYLMALHNRTSKPHYRALARWVAWSVLVDQANDGSWRHGFWEAEPEIHARFFWDGVRLLLAEHALDPRPELLEGARRAGAFALEHLSEELDEGRLWFLHDSIEGAMELQVRTPVLGRSVRNSLCLNTHVQALNVLQRLAARTDDEMFADAYRRGRDGLLAALAVRDDGWATAFLDRLLPAALAWKIPTDFAERVLRFLLYRVGAGVYWWLRGVNPGLVFGNGYLDRDLGATMLADEYHVINLKDLLELYSLDPEPWLRKVIENAAGFASSLDFGRSLARSPIWSEWADVLEAWPPDLIDLDIDRESVNAQIFDRLGGLSLDAFCHRSGLDPPGVSGKVEASGQ